MKLVKVVRPLLGMVTTLALVVVAGAVSVFDSLKLLFLIQGVCIGVLGLVIGGTWWIPLLPFFILSLLLGGYGLYVMMEGSCIIAMLPFWVVFYPGMLVGGGVAVGSLMRWLLARRGVQRVNRILTLTAGLPLLVITVFVLTMHFSSPVILSSPRSPRVIATLAERFFPPQNLYDHLLNVPLDITQEGLAGEFTLTNRYVGAYLGGIDLQNVEWDTEDELTENPSPLKLKLDFYVNGELRWSRTVNKFDADYGNINASLYRCPEDLPLGEVVTCKVTALEPDDQLAAKYGPVRFFIVRDNPYPPAY